MRELNSSDITNLLNDFLLEFHTPILSLYDAYFKKNKTTQPYREMIETLQPILRDEMIHFINLHNDLEHLKSHLFYRTNEWLRKNAPLPKKKRVPYVPICQGCKFFDRETILDITGKETLSCSVCKEKLKTEIDPKKKILLQFFIHFSKTGLECKECHRFIPDNQKDQIICPFLDCSFVGEKKNLQARKNPSNINATGQIEDDEEIFVPPEEKKLSDTALSLISTIDNLISQEVWGKNFGKKIKSKLYALQSFRKLVQSDPDTMTDYLINGFRPGNIQSRLFQEFVRILEKDLPIILIPRKKKETKPPIENLLDPRLNFFDRISVFEAEVQNGEIQNQTSEFYVGGRKGEVSDRFFIGKILSVVEVGSERNLMNQIDSYTFKKIKINGLTDGTKVRIIHLRVPPHYQMGGMVYVNRARKKIVEAIEKEKHS